MTQGDDDVFEDMGDTGAVAPTSTAAATSDTSSKPSDVKAETAKTSAASTSPTSTGDEAVKTTHSPANSTDNASKRAKIA